MSWGDLILAESSDRGEKLAVIAGNSDGKALSKIGSRSSDSTDCPSKEQATVLDMGEGSREQGFRLNGCR